jgi:hypothetical protein
LCDLCEKYKILKTWWSIGKSFKIERNCK